MLSPFDVSNLERSIAGVGESFQARREEQQREDASNEQRDLRMQMLKSQEAHQNREEAIGTERNKALAEHWKKTEEQVGLHNALQEFTNTGKQFKEAMSTLAEQVRTGAMSQADASSYFADSLDNMPDQFSQKLMESPDIRAAYEGSLDWSKVGAPADKTPKPLPQGLGETGWYDPGSGTSHPPRQQGRPVRVGQHQDASGKTVYDMVNPDGTPFGQPIASPGLKLIRNAAGQLVPAGSTTPQLPQPLNYPQQ